MNQIRLKTRVPKQQLLEVRCARAYRDRHNSRITHEDMKFCPAYIYEDPGGYGGGIRWESMNIVVMVKSKLGSRSEL